MNEETARAGIRVREAEKAHNIRTFHMGGVQKRRTLIVSKLESFYGAGGGTRTHTLSPAKDFESSSSANSNTPARFLSALGSLWKNPGNRRPIRRPKRVNCGYSVFKFP